MLKAISIPLKQLCMKCAELAPVTAPTQGTQCCQSPSAFLTSSNPGRAPATTPLRSCGVTRLTSPAASSQGSRHQGAKANQRLIKGLQRAFRSSDKAAQSNLLHSICFSWRKSTACKSLVLVTWRPLSPGRRSESGCPNTMSSLIIHCWSCSPRRLSATNMLNHPNSPPSPTHSVR